VGRRILLLISDTGGGHRAAANAIRESLAIVSDSAHEVRIVDALALGRWPVSASPRIYGPFVNRFPALWGMGYALTDSARGAHLLDRLHAQALSRSLSGLYEEFHPDLVVSCHGLLTRCTREILHLVSPATPFATVVTDLGSAHAAWFDRGSDMFFVPNEKLGSIARARGVPTDRIRIFGQPIRPVFANSRSIQGAAGGFRREQRASLGLDPAMKTALLLGGGEGFGRLDQIASAIDAARIPLQLVVVTGKNQRLRAGLDARSWNHPTKVLGFVDNLHEWMWASDLVITRAGPGVISEALAAGLPLLIHGYLPGQESGNVDLVVDSGAGSYRPKVAEIVSTLEAWALDDFVALEAMANKAADLARPQAALEIASALMGLFEAQHLPNDISYCLTSP
jgi:1,2-diacylglycerol 3-beta-galactosyltransferase